MAHEWIEIVAGAVKIGRNCGEKVESLFLPIGFGQLEPGDLGEGVPLVRRLQRPGEQGPLAHRLGSIARIDAA